MKLAMGVCPYADQRGNLISVVCIKFCVSLQLSLGLRCVHVENFISFKNIIIMSDGRHSLVLIYFVLYTVNLSGLVIFSYQ